MKAKKLADKVKENWFSNSVVLMLFKHTFLLISYFHVKFFFLKKMLEFRSLLPLSKRRKKHIKNFSIKNDQPLWHNIQYTTVK